MAAYKLWMIVVILYVVGAGCEQETTYLLENPGHSEGLAACSGNMQDTHCWRVDAPQPTEECVERDPVSQMCLRVVPRKKAAVIPQRVTGHVSVEKSPTEDTISCDGTDPLCVPDGIHLDMDIDWRAVEGAEFLIIPADAKVETTRSIFVDPDMGDDENNDGTSRDGPFRSLRRALSRWLYPGKCHPFCSSIDLNASAIVYMMPGVYSGDMNREIEVLLPKGTNLTLMYDPYSSESGTYGASTARDDSVILSNDNRVNTFSLKASGEGALWLLGISLRNSSSPAILHAATISLTTDLQMIHGRFGEWTQVGRIRMPAWDTAYDARSLRRNIKCDGSDGCVVGEATWGFDARFQGNFPASETPCEDCFVPSPEGYTGDNGLALRLISGGTGCQSDGTFIAVGKGPGSGFRADFSVEDGAISRISVVNHGSGYRDGSEVSFVIAWGGVACEGYEISPYLVIAPQYPTKIMSADSEV